MEHLLTPALVVDLDILERNCQRMLARTRELGVALRPNVKTHKSVRLLDVQMRGRHADQRGDETAKPDRSAYRIGTSTVLECRRFLEAGVGDVLYCVPLAGRPKVAEAARLCAQFPGRLSVLVDTEDGVRGLLAADEQTVWRVFVKVDSGYHRAGRSGDALDRVVAAVRAAGPRIVMRGLYTHAGHSYALQTASLDKRATGEASAILTEAKRLALPAESSEISVGATPTAASQGSEVGRQYAAGVTELHPGNYLFFDCMQRQIGSCTLEDISISVLGTVVGVYPERDSALIDVGSRALGKDALEGSTKSPWGLVKHFSEDKLQLVSISQEVGILKGDAVKDLRVGQLLEIFPNHSCITATNFSQYHLIRGGAIVETIDVTCERGF